jgi:uncharacterized protein (TIGR03435 family)
MTVTGKPAATTNPSNAAQNAWANVACGLVAIGLALLLPTARRLNAQQGAQPEARFEVASVKPNTSGTQNSRSQFQPGGRYVVSNGTIERLFRNAYSVQPFQIIGAPGWFTADRFDIDAKADGNITVPQLQAMLQTLLRERCQLTFHKETRDLPIYTLTLARPDGRRGPSLKSSAFDCSTMMNGPPPTAPAPALPNGMPPCGGRTGSGSIVLNGTSMSNFAGNLSNVIGRTVVDRTGLTGDFDLALAYVPDTTSTEPLSDLPSLFTAVQEQLGLKLEPARGPVEVFVIDRVERPVED